MTSGTTPDTDAPLPENPFVQRTRITDATRFAGRWRELSLIFDAIEIRRPVMVTGPASIGKSSLLTHITASAAVHLEEPLLPSFYLALHEAATPEDVYQTVLQALGVPGSTPSALEVALLEQETPVLLCLDDAHRALSAGWGETLLNTLARIARGGRLILVAAATGEMPLLSERFVSVRMGAFCASRSAFVCRDLSRRHECQFYTRRTACTHQHQRRTSGVSSTRRLPPVREPARRARLVRRVSRRSARAPHSGRTAAAGSLRWR